MVTRSLLHRVVSRMSVVMATGIAACLGLVTIAGCGRGDLLPAEDPSRLTIALQSPAFSDGEMIPRTSTCDGADRSPALEWSGVPDSARSLVLICDDPDAPMGTFSHWVLFNVPPPVKGLPEGIAATEVITVPSTESAGSAGTDPPRARQGTNDFGKIGYGGPCPPYGTHRYFFRLYALDTGLDLTSSARRADLLKAIQGHVLAEGRLLGRYARAR
jgi:Raf kinase inhibitor-like YbhB/YbcL family protein